MLITYSWEVETFREHLAEPHHVLSQLATEGVKLALAKGQWCQKKVAYVGLLVGPNGVEPQTGRVRAIQDIKAPENQSELGTLLGVITPNSSLRIMQK